MCMLSDGQSKEIPKCDPQPAPKQPTFYQIRVKSHLGSEWADWFEGLAITLEENGDTLLTGPVVDQAALHGLLKKVRDLGMSLVSVNPVQLDQPHPENGSLKRFPTKE
jgi:hypothetical protein